MMSKEGFYSQASFGAQQAASESLFALWYHLKESNAEVAARYNSPLKFDELAKLVPSLQKYMETYKILDSYYISARYPPPEGDKVPYEYFDTRLAEEAIGWAKQISDEVRHFINA